ncbi:hypothetical protein BOTBODRAFT_518644 [Botryobasidium botryosum FD-172 SS1]|uniref:Uncharacterized protein n=1 Tax=Botryobasidium botryosum (strain FD-172 SS1) TaxID=930990 RepID=A0A067MSU8_BOTB1|nr:hypothetical protein BOTBODRAFT_518644 [Botryobasidium botryosum FD-172 SS1]
MPSSVDLHLLANGLLYGNATERIEHYFDESFGVGYGYNLPESLRNGSLRNFLDALTSVCVSTAGQREKVAVTLTENDDSVTLHIAHTEHASGETLVAFVHGIWTILQHISGAHRRDKTPSILNGEIVLPTHEKYSKSSLPLIATVYRRCWPKIISHIEKKWPTFRRICSSQPTTEALVDLARASDHLAGVKLLLSRDDLQSDDRVATEVFHLMYQLQMLCSYSGRNALHHTSFKDRDHYHPLQNYVWKSSLHFLHILNIWLYAKSPLADTRRLFTKELRVVYLVSPNHPIEYPSDIAQWHERLAEIYAKQEVWIYEGRRERAARAAMEKVACGPTRVHPECLLLVHHHNRLLYGIAHGVRNPLENYIGCSKQRPCYMCARFFRAYRHATSPSAPEFKTRDSRYKPDGLWAMPEINDTKLESRILDHMYGSLCRDLLRCLTDYGSPFYHIIGRVKKSQTRE